MISPGLTHITTVAESLGFFRGQLPYMKARGFTVRAITSPGPDVDHFGAEYGISIGTVRMARRITPLLDMGALRQIRRLLRQHHPAIVHAHTPKGGLLGLLAAFSLATPVRIYHMRGLPFTAATGWRRQLLRSTEWLSCHLAHQVLCVSESVRTVALAAGLCPPSKIKVLGHGSGNGVDAAGRFNPDTVGSSARDEARALFGAERDDLVVGFVGRVVRDKGIVELVDAWQRIRETDGRAHLVLVGPFEPQDPIPEVTEKALRDDRRVRLIAPRRDMPRLYAGLDVVVLPTYREGFPNVLLEAAAMRLPVVATRVPGCVDAVEDGTTGVLVPPRDPTALAAAIQAYLRDPDLRQRHGEAARDRILMRFRPEILWRALYDEYLRLLELAGAFARRDWAPAGWIHGQG